jgi:putative membrane protein
MNRSARTLALAVAPAFLLLAACGGKADDAGQGTTTDTASATTAPAAPAPPPAGTDTAAAASSGTVTDPQIAAIAVAANAVDSAAGVLAQQKGTNPRVKEFASRMVTDHSGVNKQAVALVTRLGVTPEPSPTSQQLTQGGQQSNQQLSGLSGASFDRGYMDHEVEYHQTVLDALDHTLIPNAQNAELKALLQQVRPAVAAHLQMAQEIQKSLAGQ